MSDSGHPERRRLRRVVKRIPVWFVCGTLQGDGHVRNLSKEGLFLCTEVMPEAGDMVQVLIKRENGTKVELIGSVRWTTEAVPERSEGYPGFGIRLEPVTDDYRDFFESLLLH